VGVATLAVTALYECLFAYPMEELDVAECCANWPDDPTRERAIRELFAEADLRTVALQETGAKSISREKLQGQLEQLRKLWPELKPRLQKQLVPLNEVKAMLRAAGAAFEPEQIGISRERLRAGFLQASLIRRRFTVLDVVSRAGILEPFLARIFGADGIWPIAGKHTKAEVLQ
jgi:glycerol-1-phosphate dehydrogenase [NAD(P)+]